MIEIGEVLTLAGQMDSELRGKRVSECARGNTPHKWVFFNPEFDERAPEAVGKTVNGASGAGKCVWVGLEPGLRLMFGEIGGRVTYHVPGAPLPDKHHFAIRFDDQSAVSVAVQGWGFIALMIPEETAPEWASAGQDPLADSFTPERFLEIWRGHPEREKATVKAFLVNKPRIAGIGNGYAQDMLFRAGIRPARKMRDVTDDEALALYAAVRDTVQEAADSRGRDTERDLYGAPGGYVAQMDKRSKGAACRRCGATVEAVKLLGGTTYYCPGCQR